jgi:hypothetical protein
MEGYEKQVDASGNPYWVRKGASPLPQNNDLEADNPLAEKGLEKQDSQLSEAKETNNILKKLVDVVDKDSAPNVNVNNQAPPQPPPRPRPVSTEAFQYEVLK